MIDHEASENSNVRPNEFPMTIQGGMLEALGINMYTSIGKCLVEFVANAYDSDASQVSIDVPYDRIASSRREVREAAKKEVRENRKDPFTVLTVPLPEDIAIVVEDDGHGMSPEDVRSKFLPINRKRREDGQGSETQTKSDSGRRFVMGRKGLGKLAGFGAAEIVEIRTKRRGDDFATLFTMDYERLRRSENLATVQVPATYEEGVDPESHGTRICLRRLKCDAVKQSVETISETLSAAFFGISPAEFAVHVNGRQLQEAQASYEFVYAPGAGDDGFARGSFDVEDVGSVPFEYQARFRARIPDPSNPHLAFGSLPASRRGARIYCNNRLAAGPSLFSSRRECTTSMLRTTWNA